MRNWGNLQLS